MKSLRETAFHEAGHVVIAYRLSLGVGIVTIAPDDINLGSSLSEGAWLGGGMAEEVIVTYYAGYAAECLCDPDADRGGSESDDEKARELLAYCPGQTEAALRERARELVEKYRAEIEAVADALLEYTDRRRTGLAKGTHGPPKQMGRALLAKRVDERPHPPALSTGFFGRSRTVSRVPCPTEQNSRKPLRTRH
jgi:ATP-dependent Zn protease